jgi:hypothetical protein
MVSQPERILVPETVETTDVRDLLLIAIENMDEDDIRRTLKEMLNGYNGSNPKVHRVLVEFKRQLSELTGTIEII